MAVERLLLGQCDTAAAPASAAAELYSLSEGYGAAVGTDQPLLVETEDQALGGESGSVLWRRVLVPFERAGACTLRVTPIADFTQAQAATSESFDSPDEIVRDWIVVPVAATCTYGRVRIEVTARTGVVRLMKPVYRVRPLGRQVV